MAATSSPWRILRDGFVSVVLLSDHTDINQLCQTLASRAGKVKPVSEKKIQNHSEQNSGHGNGHWSKEGCQKKGYLWLAEEKFGQLKMLVETVPTLKKQQTTQEDCKDGMKLCRGKIRKTKAQLEFSLATARKDDKKCVYKYINNKRRAKENLHPLLEP